MYQRIRQRIHTLKFFKAVATYILAFVACMFLIATALKSWSGGMQAIFAFGMPGLITWWRAKTISRSTEGEMAHRLLRECDVDRCSS
jgi:hypothetical protein